MSKRMLLACVVLCGAAHVQAEVAQAAPVVKAERETLYVKMEDAMLRSKQGEEAQKAVVGEQKKYSEMAEAARNEMIQTQQKMMKIKTDMEQKEKAGIATPDALRAQERDFRNLEKKFTDMQRDMQANMNDWQNELQYTMQRETDAIMKEIEVAAKDLAISTGKKAVIDAQTGRALYLHDDLNNTDQLISVMNSSYDAKKKPKAPAAA